MMRLAWCSEYSPSKWATRSCRSAMRPGGLQHELLRGFAVVARGAQRLEVRLGGGQVFVEGRPPRDAVQDERQQRLAALHVHVLRQVAEAHGLGAVHRPAIRDLLAGNQPQQRGLAGAVGPHQADAVLLTNTQGQPLDDRATAKVQRDITEDDETHGRLLAGKPPRRMVSL
jgi:hypothetical protein